MDSPLLNVHCEEESCKTKGVVCCVHPVEGKWRLWNTRSALPSSHVLPSVCRIKIITAQVHEAHDERPARFLRGKVLVLRVAGTNHAVFRVIHS
jgi:hypothetical protein